MTGTGSAFFGATLAGGVTLATALTGAAALTTVFVTGALATGAVGAAGALAGAAALGFDFMPPPKRLACAKEGSVNEAMARRAMESWVR